MRAQTPTRTLMALLTALLLLMSAGASLVSAATPRTLQQADPFSYWMEPRYEKGWRRYDPVSHSYPSDYIYPSSWQVGFDACKGSLNAGREADCARRTMSGSSAAATARPTRDTHRRPPVRTRR